MTERTKARSRRRTPPRPKRAEATSDESNATAGDTKPLASVDQAKGPRTAPAAQAKAGETPEPVAAQPPVEAEEPVEQAVGELHHDAPETAEVPEAPPTDGEETEVPAPEVMARQLLAAWTGNSLIEEWMTRPSFRKMVISRVVKRLR